MQACAFACMRKIMMVGRKLKYPAIIGKNFFYEEDGMARGTYPLTPFLRGRGNGDGSSEGLLERFFGFYGVIYSRKAIKISRETNRQTAMRSPFPCRKGGRGDRSMAADVKDTADGNDEAAAGRGGVIRAIRVIRLIRDSDLFEVVKWERVAIFVARPTADRLRVWGGAD